jgi:hypothetical protein
VDRKAVESGAVVAVGYDADRELLQIEFPGARVYEYQAVPASVYAWLMRVPEKGSFIQRMIAPNYRYRALAPGEGREPSAEELEAALRRSIAVLRDEANRRVERAPSRAPVLCKRS